MRSKQEIRGLLEGYAKSGMTRREYCEKHKVPISTFDYWRRIQKRKPRLVEVAIETHPSTGFVLVLANGRRIESSWKFDQAGLLQLIRAAEA
jgi:hypothetical protein